MLKKILALVAMLYAAASFAAVDVNKASAADLDGVKGIGPATSSSILDERKKGNFKSWDDFIARTKGIGEANAQKFSDEGLTVNGAKFKGVKAEPKADAKKESKDTKASKTEAKADTKTAAAPAKAEAAKPAAAATPAMPAPAASAAKK
jgi:competence protein ComEA